MPASIFGSRFTGKREPAWHSLGTVFEDAPLASEAIVRSGMDYVVTKCPLFIDTPWGPMNPEAGDAGAKFALVRQPVADDMEPRLFGVCSADYEVVQNTELAEILDPLTRRWPVETAACLGLGETVLVTLTVGDDEVAGEPIKKYFLLTNSHSGGGSIRGAFTPVRVVCQNTLDAGLAVATMTSTVQHRTGARDAAEFRVNLMAALERASTDTMELMRELAASPVEDPVAQPQLVFNAAYPDPKEPKDLQVLRSIGPAVAYGALTDDQRATLERSRAGFERGKEQAKDRRAGAWELYLKLRDEFPSIAQSYWCVWNAVVEASDYREARDAIAASRSVLYGERAAEKHRAFAKCLELAGLKA
jgi:phage/plasmid-like protein (TIGR03299 family)